MLSQKVQDALNEQLKDEFYSAYLYLAMSAHCEATNLPGFARWMRLQGQEEVSHAMKLFDYLNDRGGRALLGAIAKPPAEFQSPLALFEQTLEHERQVTGKIHALYQLATQESDYPTQVMLHWFIEEQVEEEKSVSEIVAQLKLIGDHIPPILMLDHRLGQRAGE